MIAKAERLERFIQFRPSSRASSSRRKSRSRTRSRSRSRSRERTGKYNTSDYVPQYTGKKQVNKKPKDNNDLYQQSAHRSSSCTKNWKKDNKNNDRKCEAVESVVSRSSEIDAQSNVSEVDKDKDLGVLSEAEMNKLGSRIVKAEITGDEVRYLIFLITRNFLIPCLLN